MSRRVTITDRTTLRFVVVGLIALVLLIPLLFVGGLVDERRTSHQRVKAEVGQGWGRAQHVQGPLLIVPVIEIAKSRNADGYEFEREVRRDVIVVPQVLDVTVNLSHRVRTRSIYQVPVYLAKVDVSGRFADVRSDLAQRYDRVLWTDAKFVIGLGDTSAIRRAEPLHHNGAALPLLPGAPEWLGPGVQIDASSLDPAKPFEISLLLAGTERFQVAPIADQTRLTMTSSWPHPKFTGRFLPTDHDVSDAGFTANWEVTSLARGTPSMWVKPTDSTGLPADLWTGVKLFEPVTGYSSVDRGIKYAVLFIALTFVTILGVELKMGLRFHPVQYGVAGLTLVVFYLTLLALSEQVAFGVAYVLAACVIVAMLAAYVWSLCHSWRVTVVFAVIEAALYWVLFVILRLEDYALLTGTGVLLLGLAILMLVTRQLPQFGLGRAQSG